MASPLEQFTNARLLYEAPGAQGGPEVGFAYQPGQRYLVLAFLKQKNPAERSNYANLRDMSISTDIYGGYVTGFLPLGVGDDWETVDVAGRPDLDLTALRPPGLAGGVNVTLLLGDRRSSAAEVMDSESKFGDLGIGAILRDVIGDRLVVLVEWSGS